MSTIASDIASSISDSLTEFTPPMVKAYSPLPIQGLFKAQAEDFQVTEILGFTPSGNGEHHLVFLEKRHENTQWVASQIAKLAGVKPAAVGYCGRKDRMAVTSQWFSVQCPGQSAPEWSQLVSEHIRIRECAQHIKKLRPGMHSANRFDIRLTQLQSLEGQPLNTQQIQALEERLDQIAQHGVPNYFGAQRFGRLGQNLAQAKRWFETGKPPRRDQRGMILSSARSLLFNTVLARRVQNQCWQNPLEGEPMTDGPSGPMWGRGRSLASGQTLALETDALCDHALWQNALEHQGLTQDRRPLVLKPQALSYSLEAGNDESAGSSLKLTFTLPAGGFATTLINELIRIESPF